MTRLQQAELCPTRESSDGLLLLGRSVLIYLSSEVEKFLVGWGAGLMRWGESGTASGSGLSLAAEKGTGISDLFVPVD